MPFPTTKPELDNVMSIMKQGGASIPEQKAVVDEFIKRQANQSSVPSIEKPGLGKQAADFVSTAGAKATSEVGKGLGNLAKATDYINPVSWLAKAMGKEDSTFGAQTQKGLHKLADQPMEVQEKLGTTETTGGKLGETTGGIIGAVGKQVPGLVGGAELLSGIKSIPAFQRLAKATPAKAQEIADFITKSVGSTEAIVQAEEGRLATPAEIGFYGALDGALFGIGKLGNTLYKSAFKGTKGQERNLIKQFDKTVADVAEELGYTGTARQIEETAQAAQKNIFSEIQQLAEANKPVTRDEFIEIVQKPLLKRLEKLPQSQFRQELGDTLTTIVEQYAPVSTATGEELIATLTQINKGLFGEGSRTVLTPKQAKSIESDLKQGIKDLLPDDIKPLYEGYAKNKLIEQVIADARIQRLLGRSLLGGAAGTISGVTAGVSTGQDFTSVMKSAIAGALIGAAAGRATGSTGLKTVGGKALEKAPTADEMVKIIINRIIGQED